MLYGEAKAEEVFDGGPPIKGVPIEKGDIFTLENTFGLYPVPEPVGEE